jgi:hypothetical protein
MSIKKAKVEILSLAGFAANYYQHYLNRLYIWSNV